MTDREKWEELVAWHRKWDDNSRAEKPVHNPGYDANPSILWADRRIKALEKVREAAEKLEGHWDGCAVVVYPLGDKRRVCRCGFDALMAALAAAEEEEG